MSPDGPTAAKHGLDSGRMQHPIDSPDNTAVTYRQILRLQHDASPSQKLIGQSSCSVNISNVVNAVPPQD